MAVTGASGGREPVPRHGLFSLHQEVAKIKRVKVISQALRKKKMG
jgi:hypothetical protein